jgi:hypothetical protein
METGGGAMKKTTWVATCTAIAFGLAASLLAQTSATSQSSSPKTITVSGCIQRATHAPTGTSGTAGAAAENDAKFTLTNASLSTTGTTGTAGSMPPSTAVASEYRLDADDAKLTPHVGHKVEISGTVEQAASSTPSSASSAANAPKLKVDAVKMIASTCP